MDHKTVSLRTVADRVGLAPCSVSAVLNRTPASLAIPQRTKDRVFRAAAQLNYRPNFSARSLRTKRTHMVAVISDDFGRASVARVVAGMERRLRRRGYLLVLGAFDSAAEWNGISVELQQRGVEGVVAVGTRLPGGLEMPVVSVDLGTMSARDFMTEDVSAWLTGLGESAVETVLSKIETKSETKGETKLEVKVAQGTKPHRTTVARKPPQGYFNLPGPGPEVRLEISAAGASD